MNINVANTNCNIANTVYNVANTNYNVANTNLNFGGNNDTIDRDWYALKNLTTSLQLVTWKNNQSSDGREFSDTADVRTA